MDSLLALVTEPLSHAFMQRALAMAVLIAIVCSIFSCFLVLKGWSLMGDAVSHAVLPGVALAYLAGLPLPVGAFVAGLLCALGTGWIKANSRLKEDAVMGILFSGMFALGLVLLTGLETDVHLLHVLFGDVLGIRLDDIYGAGGVALICSVVMLLKRRDLMLYCFDPGHAAAIGLPVRALHFGLLILLALTIVAALQAAGIILVVAMLIAPGTIGFLLCRRFDSMLVAALVASVFSCVVGVISSYHLDVATAPLIVVIQSGLFILALIFDKTRHLWKGRA